MITELHRVRQEELLRIGKIAAGLLVRFGPVIAVGFLYYELLGRPPNDAEASRQAHRLRRSPSTAPAIIEELLRSVDSREQVAVPARDPGSTA